MSGICSIHKDFNPACTICLSDKVVEIEIRVLKLEARKKRVPKLAEPFALPVWVPSEAWAGFEEMRRKARKPMTDRARWLIIAELERLQKDGHAPGPVLDQSIRKNWLDVYAIKENGQSSSSSDKYREELRLLLNNSNNKCLPGHTSDGAKVVFRSTGMSWSKLQESVQAGIIPF